MEREIKFRAWVPSIQTFLYEIAIYPDGMIGMRSEYFSEQLRDEYDWDGEEVRTILSEDGESGYDLVLTTLAGDEWIWIEKGKYELMQYNGMTDCNGTDCYEHDIVKTPYGIGKIIFEFGCFMIEWLDDKEAMMELLAFEPNNYRYGRVIKEWEVIGNIYENPELLVKQQTTPHGTFTLKNRQDGETTIGQ